MRHVIPTTPFVVFSKEDVAQSIPQRFQQQVDLYPNRLAVKTNDHVFSYDTLNRLANRVARAILHTRDQGAEPIALFFESGALIVAAMLGVLKAGKFYVPLDASMPSARLHAILDDAQPGLILTDNKQVESARSYSRNGRHLLNIDELETHLSPDNLDLPISPDALAYILYTSGSTGQPKGVMQDHQYVLHLTKTYTNSGHMSADDRFALLYSPSFAGAVRDVYCALLNGAALFPFDIKQEGLMQLASWLIQEEITIFFAVATMFRHFADLLTGREQFPSLRLIQIGSETVYKRDVDLYKQHFSADCLLIANLGGSEISPVRQYVMDKETEINGSTVPAGYSVEDTEVRLWNDMGQEVGVNQIGEIVVRSRYLSPGYWRRPELTQATFLPDPEGGQNRLYKTGDLGRLLPDGCLLHLGRKDFQVKVRGYRVEVAEVEMALLKTNRIREAVVLASPDPTGDQQLVAYLVPTETSQTASIRDLRRVLADALPDYMIPTTFVVLEALPLTPTGKVDRQALSPPSQVRPEQLACFIAPRTPVEQRLTDIWTQVLRVEQIGIDDNFFDLGGHSLLATQIMARLPDAFSVHLPVQTLFEAPTVAELSERIENVRWSVPPPADSTVHRLNKYEEGVL